MSDIGTEESKNKTPHKMARLAWPKSKYGVILAIIIAPIKLKFNYHSVILLL